MRVLIVVTHLLGTGHLSRALNLARALQAAGDRVCVVSGGMPAPHLDQNGIEVVQLPPLRSDGVDFARLLNDQGARVTEKQLTQRQTDLVMAFTAEAWDVVITELFPFGRRSLRKEFLALLEAARNRPRPPVICASVRDILAPPSTPAKAVKTQGILDAYYDAVLVHSDPAITPLDTSWPVNDTLRAMLHYTGFVAPPPAAAHPGGIGRDEVIVSAGGGDVGAPVFAAALAAARRSDLVWRLLLGGANAHERIATLRNDAPANVVLEPARPDFRQLLPHAAACVSLCGYNTALDVLQSGCPAVFIPFDAGDEVEQTLRATALAAQDGIALLPTAKLDPDSLLAAVSQVRAAPARRPATHSMNGTERTPEILRALLAGDE